MDNKTIELINKVKKIIENNIKNNNNQEFYIEDKEKYSYYIFKPHKKVLKKSMVNSLCHQHK